ncbi:MAG: hypothetical protein IJ344_01110 [Clostridia bacterium]|nr:hypothetical protein [Clostridia bacterium]
MQKLYKMVIERAKTVKRTAKESVDLYFLWLFVLAVVFWGSELFFFAEAERPFLSALFATLLVPTVFFSIKRILSDYSADFQERYTAAKEAAGKKPPLSFYLLEKRLWAELGVFALIYWLFPLKVFFAAPCALFFGGADGLLQKAILFLPFVLCLLVLSVLARCSAAKHFERHKRGAQNQLKALMGVGKKDKKTKALMGEAERKLLSAMTVYLLGGTLLTCYYMYLVFFVKLIVLLFTTPQTLIPILLLAVGIPLARLVNGITKRARFYKALKKSCDSRGYRFCDLHRPYLSLIRWFESDAPTFTVAVGEKRYACKMVSAHGRNAPLFFFDRGEELEGARLHKIRLFRQDIFSWEDHFLCGFPSEHKRIIIVNPVCKRLCTAQNGKVVELDNGDEIGKYELYTGRAFINALERDVIDRKV